MTSRLIDTLGGGAPPGSAEWQQTSPWVRAGRRMVIGMLIIVALATIVLSINGAVVASGTVTFDGYYKTVQHLDGGIVSAIHVKNGDKVKPGDPLLSLDATAARANLAIVAARIADLAIQEARLEAERDQLKAFELSADLLTLAAEPAGQKVYFAQKALFNARLATRVGEQAMLEQRVAQSDAELRGLTAQLAARDRERALNAEELQKVRPLFDKGFANQQRLGLLERDAARLEGDVGRLQSEIARARGAAAEARLRRAQSDKDFVQAVVDELRRVQAQLTEAREQATTLRDRLERIDIRAPHAGRVHALSAHTVGGVIQPGTQILQIVPDGDKLIVEAQIPPQEIDKVRAGLVARVRFPAFNARLTPKLSGVVKIVSPAQLTDPQGRSYFTAQIDIPPSELRMLGAGHRLVPGMPAEVYVETEARSVMSYLLRPLTDALTRSMRES